TYYSAPLEDYQKAVYWIQKAAEQGHSGAQFILGEAYYYEGRGMLQDYQQAAYWYQKAAEQGNAKAQNRMGEMYYHVLGVPKDYKQAANWMEQAMNNGDWDAAAFWEEHELWKYH
ncbi:MAG: tetratricopeptide repeat protein, partial [Sphingobacteriia bacterium]